MKLSKALRQAAGMPHRAVRNLLVRVAMPEIKAAFYEGASQGRRMASLRTAASGPNTAVYEGLQILRSRTRDLVRNNPWAENAEDSFVGNLVGTGIKPRWIMPDNPELKEIIQQRFKRWTDQADANGVCDYYGMQALVARTYFNSGESLARKRYRRPRDGMAVPYQLQLLEPDHLDSGIRPERWGGNRVLMGIEFDAVGRRVAYHLSREHPGDVSIMSARGGMGTVRVPAREMLHVFSVKRQGQIRGLPKLASIIVRLHMLDSYEDSTAERNRMAAMFMGFIKRITGGPMPGKSVGTDAKGKPVLDLEAGTLMELGEDEDIVFANPPGTEGSFDAWVSHELRACAAGVGLTYEQLTGDMRQSNYTKSRVALLEFRRRCEMLQFHMLVFQFCRPVIEDWMDAAVFSGALPIDPVEYLLNREYYTNVQHCPQGWDWVDPLKDGQAEILLLNNKIKSRAEIIAGRGEDIEEVDRQIAEDEERAARLGIGERQETVSVPDPGEKDDEDEDEREKEAA